MAIRYLKEGKTQTARAEDDAEVRKNVEEILASIETEGDVAVRRLSEKFDNYSPPVFGCQSEIDADGTGIDARYGRFKIRPGTGQKFCPDTAR